jgi:AbrB family looped-hinge helix DNA binding protein
MSTNYEAVVQPEGRVLIPSELRKALGIGPGTRVVLSERDGGVLLMPRDAVKQQLRHLFAHVSGSMADELIAERHEEAAKEQLP